VDAEGLAALVNAVRQAEAIMGSAAKSRSAEQTQAGMRYFRSIVARRDIDAGEALSLENVGFMRTLPQQRGAEPARWEQWRGLRTLRPLQRYQAIRPEDLEQGELGK
jgi:sialic acid synthase SpsE